MGKQDKKPITLRLPIGMKERVKEFAEGERRSVNNLILVALEKYMNGENKKGVT